MSSTPTRQKCTKLIHVDCLSLRVHCIVLRIIHLKKNSV